MREFLAESMIVEDSQSGGACSGGSDAVMGLAPVPSYQFESLSGSVVQMSQHEQDDWIDLITFSPTSEDAFDSTICSPK